MKKLITNITVITLTAVLLSGCASMPTVTETPLDRNPITSKLESLDVSRTVEKMAESLVSAPGVLEA
ncbi:MAG: hypothetical protein RBT40_13405, partial [Petrimonas sp.]|nr:hypothetical protein [Petrimonas sp.]